LIFSKLFSIFSFFHTFFVDKQEKTIAPGPFGAVSIVTHIASGRKLVWKKIALVEGKEEEIKREAQIRKEMNCPWIVSILDSFCDEDCLYIVMEFFEKGTLKELWDELMTSGKTIDEEVFFFLFLCSFNCFLFCSCFVCLYSLFKTLLNILAEGVSGVNELHRKKIVHRDLRLENIFISKYGHYKIGDFSVSVIFEGTFEKRNTIIGTQFSFLFLFSLFFFFFLFSFSLSLLFLFFFFSFLFITHPLSFFFLLPFSLLFLFLGDLQYLK
jgi:serine/threonine protein kinase